MEKLTVKDKTVISLRQRDIAREYLKILDEHIASLKEGKEERAFEIGDFANMMHMHPVHLSNTIKAVTGQSTCSLYEERLVKISKELLLSGKLSIKQIAIQLTYDPSNFTKFFKHFVGMTPKQFREANM